MTRNISATSSVNRIFLVPASVFVVSMMYRIPWGSATDSQCLRQTTKIRNLQPLMEEDIDHFSICNKHYPHGRTICSLVPNSLITLSSTTTVASSKPKGFLYNTSSSETLAIGFPKLFYPLQILRYSTINRG